MSLQDIQSLWVGYELGAMEKLTIASFIDSGHNFILWTYYPIINVPNGVEIKDANNIINKNKIFSINNNYSFFINMFKFKLLYEAGGFWADMDTYCLRGLDFTSPYVLKGNTQKTDTNILRTPPKKKVILETYNRLKAVSQEKSNKRLPIKIFSYLAKKHKITCFTKPNSCFIRDELNFKLFDGDIKIKNQYAFCWNKDKIKESGRDIEKPKEGTFYKELLVKHGILN